MERTFTKEISWISYELNDNTKGLEEVQKTANVTFKSLNQTDKSQHKLHFMIISMFQSGDGDAAKLDSDVLYDITVKAVNQLVVCDENFKERDKTEFLHDSMALLQFGLWLFGNQFAPFFQKSALK